MGCCQSAESAHEASPYPNSPAAPRPLDVATNGPSSFSRSQLINQSNSTDYNSSGLGGAVPANTAPRGLAHHPNRPLRLPAAWKSSKTRWSRQTLDRERHEFFETRVSGRSEIWGVVRLATESLRQGDVASAQGLLDASGCTCPTGDMVQGVYDERGALYGMPQWVISDPQNMVDGSLLSNDHMRGAGKAGALDGAGETELADAESKKSEKGKGRLVDVKDAIKLKARLSDRATDVIVVAERDQPVHVLIRRIQEEAGIATDVKVKIAYLGKLLKDDQPLVEQGWQQGHVVNALVFQ